MPTTEAVPAAGAVDIRKIEAAKPKPKPKPEVEQPKPEKPKPAPPSHPSRIWVQLGVGQDKAAMAYDWRKLTRKFPDLFKGKKAYVSEMGRTNRMLAGPFDSMKDANAFISSLEKSQIDRPYVWTSPAGQVVDTL